MEGPLRIVDKAANTVLGCLAMFIFMAVAMPMFMVVVTMFMFMVWLLLLFKLADELHPARGCLCCFPTEAACMHDSFDWHAAVLRCEDGG